ncbi:MAG TPA: hypothetical protein VFG45_04090 [Candidatus Nitrosocosmicus sp.]|nr:hypothetical protein [Candidatus Nitrosocosmicus sp.]
MAIIYVISVKNALLTPDLSNSESAKQFFTHIISEIIVDNIVIDFSGVRQMNHSFALQYLKSKQSVSLKKVIKEICVPKSVCQMIKVAQKKIDRSALKPLYKKEIMQNKLPTT